MWLLHIKFACIGNFNGHQSKVVSNECLIIINRMSALIYNVQLMPISILLIPNLAGAICE